MSSVGASAPPSSPPGPSPVRTWRPTILHGSIAAGALLMAASWVFVLRADSNLSAPFFSVSTAAAALGFLKALLGIGSTSPPAFFSAQAWRETSILAYQTLAMSVLGIGIATSIALVTFVFGARNIMLGDLAPYGSHVSRAVFLATRLLFLLTRGIPELVWAMVIIFILHPGILPGAIALGLHNGGVLGKLGSEVVEGMDPRPVRALRSTGARHFQLLLYGVLPQCLPRLITYLLYRWEVIIRTTIVVGFVAAGGLGMEFRLNMSHFHYTSVLLVILWYFLLVLAVDLAAAGLRQLAK